MDRVHVNLMFSLVNIIQHSADKLHFRRAFMYCQDSSFKLWSLLKQCTGVAGVIARTVRDVILFDSIFSDCHYPRPDMELKGYRLGYPVNYWKGLDTRVSLSVRCIHTHLIAAVLKHTHAHQAHRHHVSC